MSTFAFPFFQDVAPSANSQPGPRMRKSEAQSLIDTIVSISGRAEIQCSAFNGQLHFVTPEFNAIRLCANANEGSFSGSPKGFVRWATSVHPHNEWSPPPLSMPPLANRHPFLNYSILRGFADSQSITLTNSGDSLVSGPLNGMAVLGSKTTATRLAAIPWALFAHIKGAIAPLSWFSVQSSSHAWLGNESWAIRVNAEAEPSHPRALQRILLSIASSFRVNLADFCFAPSDLEKPAILTCMPDGLVSIDTASLRRSFMATKHTNATFGIVRIPMLRIITEGFLSDTLEVFLPPRPAMPGGFRRGNVWVLSAIGK